MQEAQERIEVDLAFTHDIFPKETTFEGADAQTRIDEVVREYQRDRSLVTCAVAPIIHAPRLSGMRYRYDLLPTICCGVVRAVKVLAYDDNRDLICDADGEPMTVTRDPLPEVLRGNPDRTEALIDASRHQWTYRAGVISFAATDAPSEEQQPEVMDHFEDLAFAGLDPTQYEMLWVRHTHEDRVELHFCTPRLELTSGRSLNIAPPGYQNAFDSLRT